jgi:hypothetical protein
MPGAVYSVLATHILFSCALDNPTAYGATYASYYFPDGVSCFDRICGIQDTSLIVWSEITLRTILGLRTINRRSDGKALSLM